MLPHSHWVSCAFQIDLQRAIRKQAQCETFALIIQQLIGKTWAVNNTALQQPLQQPQPSVPINRSSSKILSPQSPQHQQPTSRTHIVEFGSGSGNLLLPLAHTFSTCHFHGVDAKEEAVLNLQRRAVAAGLDNVTVSQGLIQDYQGRACLLVGSFESWLHFADTSVCFQAVMPLPLSSPYPHRPTGHCACTPCVRTCNRLCDAPGTERSCRLHRLTLLYWEAE